jgi:simple sugar transport system substrate-binding protein
MRRSSIVVFFLAVTLAFSSCTGAGKPAAAGRTYLLVAHGPPGDTFWNVVRKGMTDGAKSYNASITYLGPQSADDTAAVRKLLQQAIDAKPDGLIVTVHDYLAPELANAQAAHIPLIAINSPPSVNVSRGVGGQYLFYIGQKEVEAGTKAGQKLQTIVTAQGLTISKAYCVKHQDVANLEARCSGLQSVFGDKYEEVQIYDPSGAKDAIKQSFKFQAGNNVVALALGPPATTPLLAAIQEDSNVKNVIAGTFDSSDDTVSAIRGGQLQFYVDQQPYLQSYLAVTWLELYLSYGLLPPPDTDESTGPGFVDQSNIDAVTAAVKAGAR